MSSREDVFRQLSQDHVLKRIQDGWLTDTRRISFWWDQLFPDRDWTGGRLFEYLCAVHGFTQAEANELTTDRVIEILHGAVEAVGKAPGPSEPPPCLVTLQQAAAIVHRSKKTLERYKKNDSAMPQPKVQGGGGKSDLWAWPELRVWLEKQFEQELPDRFPGDRIRPT
jgi:hypothetical protein